jgi:hypothetical protein
VKKLGQNEATEMSSGYEGMEKMKVIMVDNF